MRPAILLTFSLLHYAATTEIYTLSLHDALPISRMTGWVKVGPLSDLGEDDVQRFDFGERTFAIYRAGGKVYATDGLCTQDRKSTRLNSSHVEISYAVFCLKKKNMRLKRVLRLLI